MSVEPKPPPPEEPKVPAPPEPVAVEPRDLPLWLRTGVIGSFAAGLLVHITYDAVNNDYEGTSTSLMLGGIVGAALSLDEYLRRGGEKK